MSRERITNVEGAAALLLPLEVLDKLGIAVGDEVEVTLAEGALVIRSLDEAKRSQQLEDIVQKLFKQRQSAYEELAKGAE